MDSMPEGEPDDQQHIEPKNQEPEEIDDQRPAVQSALVPQSGGPLRSD